MIITTVTCARTAAIPLMLKNAATPASSKCISRIPGTFTCGLRPSPTQPQLRFLSQRTVFAPGSTARASIYLSIFSRYRPSSTRSLATSSTTVPKPRPSAQSPSPSPTSTAPPPPSPSTADSILTWNAYLPLRRKRHRYNTVSSILTGLVTFAGGISFLATQDLEKLSSLVFGLDPFIALGACGLMFGMVGWLVGPFAGDAVFRVVYRRYTKQMEVMEKDLFRRIQKFRCDPSSTSVNNPVPDYYGEKISSVRGYRQWLRDQRNFGKKRETPKML